MLRASSKKFAPVKSLHRHSRILFLAAVYPVLIAAAWPNHPERDIRSIILAQQKSWNRGDIDGFMQAYAHSTFTTFVSGDTVTRGWQTVRDRYHKKYSDRDKMGTLAFSDLQITAISSDSALAVGKWRLTRAHDQPHGRFTLLFKHLPEGWRIVHDHTSSASK